MFFCCRKHSSLFLLLSIICKKFSTRGFFRMRRFAVHCRGRYQQLKLHKLFVPWYIKFLLENFSYLHKSKKNNKKYTNND